MISESLISVLCDCPYTGKTREIKGSPESEEGKRRELKQEIKKTKEDLINARNVLMNTRRQLAAFQRILGLELGWIINPYIKNISSWKDRVQEESYLKSELIHVVDYLRQCDYQYVQDPSMNPTKLSASTEDLLFEKQEEKLKNLYHDYTVYLSENDKRVGATLSNFLKLKENYENKLYCNKIIQQEIASVKKKICDLQRQFFEDKCLIDYITDHHFTMKGTFSDISPEKRSPNSDNQTTNEKCTETEKYKKMWEQSRNEKIRLSATLQGLRKRLEFVDQKVIRAENICSGNIVSLRLLAKKLKDNILLSKMQPKRKEEFGKFSFIQYRSQTNQLEAAISENQYLRNFLNMTVLTKTENLKNFRKSLLSTAGKYRVVLEDIRTKLTPPPPPPPPPPVEEKKVSKKKTK